MPAIDFRELASGRTVSPAGENLEGLVREIGKRLGINPDWSGRGADQGRDLIFTERRDGPLGNQYLRWLVSCKDFAGSGRSVTEQDVGSVLEKIRQHGANGFLLTTTTTASAGLKAMLDGLRNNGSIETLVWDRHELEEILLRAENSDLIKRHFPESYAALQRLSGLPQALDSLQTLVPGPIHERIKSVIETYSSGDLWLTGDIIWPHDRESALTIDKAIRSLLEDKDPVNAAEILQDGKIEFDAFEAILVTLNTFRPMQVVELCHALIKSGESDGSSLFAFRFHVDHHEPTNDEQIALAVDLPREDLYELYADEVSAFIADDVTTDPGAHQAWGDLDALSPHTRVEEVYTSDVELTADPERHKINFKADITFGVELEYDHETSSSSSLPGQAEGYIDANGIFLELVTVDTRSFYR